MKKGTAHFERFVHAVHRRLAIVRAAELAGVFATVAGAVAILLACALWWQGRDALTLCGFALVVGAMLGLFVGILRRPSLLDAAMEADRQLDLADLLSTALSRRHVNDPWQGAVLAMAEARCATLAPSSVIVARLGGRAWGGIGLAAALVMTVGVMSSLPRETVAVDLARSGTVVPSEAPDLSANDATPSIVQPANSSPLAKTPAADDGAVSEERTAEESLTSSQVSDPLAKGDRPGDGGGQAVVPRSPQAAPRLPGSVPGDENASGDYTVPGDGGRGVSRPEAAAANAAGSTSSPPARDSAHTPPPPWQTSSWPADQAAADAAVREGKIGDQYRDVVRQYFRQQQ